MHVPFALKLLSSESTSARALATALVPALASRGARVTLDDEPAAATEGCPVRITTGERALPGTVVAIGVLSPDGSPRWLTPLAAEGSPDEATRGVLTFLERWGFIPSVATARSHAS